MKVMVIIPHPDDAEGSCGGTMAKWAREGREIIYVLCTNGDKGSSDPQMTSERLAAIREEEQRKAAQTLGVKEVVFLNHPDGELEDNREFRGELVRLIRKYRPDVAITIDPYRRTLYPGHRDHRITGMVALDALFAYSPSPQYYPQHLSEGLLPHQVGEVYLWGFEEPDTYVDISDTIDQKIAALRCHDSQVGQARIGGPRSGTAPNPREDLEGWIRQRAASLGEGQGIPFAEAFRRFERPPIL